MIPLAFNYGINGLTKGFAGDQLIGHVIMKLLNNCFMQEIHY